LLSMGITYLAGIGPDNPLTPLQGASSTYRVAFGPRAGQKVLSLQTIVRRVVLAQRRTSVLSPLSSESHRDDAPSVTNRR
jgi:hypothetical protein